ncbi:PREDICTED: SH3 domain and tetratricopeptide repeat-containing protein 1 [Nanorana parkeri]|uniref:SH3 domain and tetratricopeptide repeat-containing protein 1 n=1 Tax=Nanorana parkeri TaxID=125878 RepID=UPI0008546F23|nr:PREDICTED: SH3 domain and tetratricopeptide repeat-containing protein 1 [Nanorana parkeri]
MEPGGVNVTPQPTMVFSRLHPIVEDESEETEDLTSAGDNGAAIGNDSIESGNGTSKDSPRSFVASVKKAISSIGSNDESRISDFVHINDCLKERSGTFSDPTDAFVSDLSLQLVMVRKGKHDAQLQAELRNRLRLLENDSKEVAAVFCELSARLLSIESDKDVITVTFRTFEEIWKFSTYYSLGFLNHCMENMFLDQTFWLTSLEDEGAGIQVLVNEESLNHMYKGLLMEEGILFALCADKCIQQATVVDNKVQIIQSTPEAQRHTAGWTQPDSSSDEEGGLFAEAEPLCPFHQWFMRTNVGSDLVDFGKSELRNQIAVGWTEAVVNFDSDVPDEMSYQSGDIIETVSTYIECIEWFVGSHVTSGCVGFVRTQNVRPYTSENGQESSSPVVCEDTIYTRSTEDFDLESAKALLLRISHSDVCHVYKLDEFEKIKVYKNKVSEECDQTSYNDSANLKETLEEFLVKSNNCPEEITVFEENNTDSSEAQTICDTCKDTRFCICEEQYEWLQSLLQFLNSGTYLPGFKKLYDVSYTFLTRLFYGYGEEEDLVRHLSVAREAAKKASMTWALARLCFLLGRLCTRKHKFSQARVYFEEAMGVLNGDFSDIFLFTAIHMNLNAIYLKQKSKEKSMQMMDKSSSLILGLQNYISNTDMEPVVLKYALKKAILSQDQKSERNACFLLCKTFTSLRQYDEALPYIERLQVLQNMTASSGCSPSRYYFQLADMYSHKCLPHLTLSCVKVASQNSCGLMESLRRVDFIIKNASKLCGMKRPGNKAFPTQIAYHLKCALKSVVTKQEQELCTFMYLGIAELCAAHQLYKEARAYIMKAVNSAINRQVDIWIMLAWMYMLDGHSIEALDILNFMVSFSGCTQHQLGIINNLIAIAVRRGGMIKDAAKHYCKALQISKDTGNFQNQAMVLANLGTLCLHLKARIVAEHFLVRSVSVYSSVPHVDNRADFIQVLLILGHHFISRDQKETGKLYYEWALLVAMESKNLQGQLHAVQLLCQFYSTYEVNEAQCIIYNEYQLSLAKKMADKVLEGQVLETISQLYLSLGTERACRSALEYTKRSLGIFIDLQAKEKEAYAWLMAGKIYYILDQNELVDLYIQVAQNVALCTGDPNLGMALYEACGDIFFNGTSDRDKAVTFYRDCALPLAVKTGNEKAELQLCNKLTGLLMSIKDYEEALDYAKTALALSVNLGNQLNERVAYHRLGGIYTHLNQCELAEHFYLKALSLCSSPLELEEETIYYMKVYLILGDIIFYHLKDPYDAAGYYYLALAAAMDLGNKKSQLKIYTQLAVIYHNFLMDREKSLFFYQKARAFATDLNVRRINLSPVQYNQNPP